MVGLGCLVLVDSVLEVALGLGVLGVNYGETIMSCFTTSYIFSFGMELHSYLMVAASF